MSPDEQITYELIKSHKYIWGFMYGRPYFNVAENGRLTKIPDVLIRIETAKLEPLKDEYRGVCYVWGWPGPDANMYYFDDYKKTWCFDPSEIPDATVHELDRKYVTEVVGE